MDHTEILDVGGREWSWKRSVMERGETSFKNPAGLFCVEWFMEEDDVSSVWDSVSSSSTGDVSDCVL